MSLKWDFSTLADRLGEAVSSVEAELRLEQAVYGLDARDERAIQELVAERLAAWYGVTREVHYPSSRGNKLTHRMRCDLVLTPLGTSLRLDPTKAAVEGAARAEARVERERGRAEKAEAKERGKRERLVARAEAKAQREAAKAAKKLAKLRAKAGEGPGLFGEGGAAEAAPVAEVAASVPEADMVVEATTTTIIEDTLTPASFAEPSDALWLEVKVAYQFREGGVRHGGYGAQWRQAVVADLQKMEAEPLVREAGLVLVVFNESEGVLAKDLELFEDVLARKEVLAGFRQVRTVKIQDRIGHAICTVAVWPTVQR